MQVLFEDKYLTICLDEQNGILHNDWSFRTERMNEDEYKELIQKQVSCIRQNRPKAFFVDMSMFHFVLEPALQEWLDALFPDFLAVGVKHIALVNSFDLVDQLCLERWVEEQNVATKDFDICYFERKSKAIDWLKNPMGQRQTESNWYY